MRAREEAGEALSREQRAAGESRRLELELGNARSELAAIGKREALAELELRQLQEELMQRAADADQARQAEQAAAARARSLQVATPRCRLKLHLTITFRDKCLNFSNYNVPLQPCSKISPGLDIFYISCCWKHSPSTRWCDDHLRHTELNTLSAKLTCAGGPRPAD